jgi:hypothetical protein
MIGEQKPQPARALQPSIKGGHRRGAIAMAAMRLLLSPYITGTTLSARLAFAAGAA